MGGRFGKYGDNKRKARLRRSRIEQKFAYKTKKEKQPVPRSAKKIARPSYK